MTETLYRFLVIFGRQRDHDVDALAAAGLDERLQTQFVQDGQGEGWWPPPCSSRAGPDPDRDPGRTGPDDRDLGAVAFQE